MPDKKESDLPKADQFETPAQDNPDKQLLGKKAEEYLREGGKIEDYPEPDGEPSGSEKSS